MKIGVLLKQVPDSETKIKVKADGSGIETGDIKYVINPFDEYAVEEALKLKAKKRGEVVIFSFGPKKADEAIRGALAMGADRGVRVDSTGLEGSDNYAVARVLAAAVKAEGMDIVFAGKQAIDDDAAQVPQLVAEFLDWPEVGPVEKFELVDDSTIKVERAIGGGSKEVIESSLPAVVAAEKGLNTPRYASLPGIMKAKRKKIDVKKPDDLGVPSAEMGAEAALVQVTRWSPPPVRAAGKILKGELSETIPQLVKLLHEEAKVI